MTMMIKPAAGKAIRDPHTLKVLAESGEQKPRNAFWLRRLAMGDVVEIKTAKKTASRSKSE